MFYFVYNNFFYIFWDHYLGFKEIYFVLTLFVLAYLSSSRIERSSRNSNQAKSQSSESAKRFRAFDDNKFNEFLKIKKAAI